MKKYDIIIVGAGPAGLAAAIYGRRADKSVLVIERSTFGGQITHSPRVENYPGFSALSGTELADNMVSHALSQGADIELDTVLSIDGELGEFSVKCEGGEYLSKTVIIATGSKHRTLGIEREDEFVGEGISYCAVCDGAFYRDCDVAVIGGGNSALVEAVMLSDIAKKVYIVQNLNFLTGEAKLIADVSSRENVEIILGATVKGIIADDKFKGITLDLADGERQVYVDATFVAIGQVPENEPFKNLVSLDDRGYIEADESCVSSMCAGVYVAGDCRRKAIRQVSTAISDGAVAALAACRDIDSLSRE